MAGEPAIKISGLKELRSSLKKAGAEFPKQLSDVNYTVVSQIVVPAAQQGAAGTFISNAGKAIHPGAAVVGSIRALRQQKAAYVAIGSNKVPWAAGYEFGSLGQKRTGKGGHTTQFPHWRGNSDEAGYFVWPAIRGKQAEIVSAYVELLARLTSMAFPD